MRALVPLAIALAAPVAPAWAECYDLSQTRVLMPYAAAAPTRQVTVIIDQTTAFPPEVGRHVATQVVRLAAPGTVIGVGSFSSYSGTRFPRIDTPLRARNGAVASKTCYHCGAIIRAETDNIP